MQAISEDTKQVVPSRRETPKALWPLTAVLLFFFALYLFIVPTEGGDTLRYANDALLHAKGLPGQFWEFGHLLWRPWGYLGYLICGPFFQTHFGDNDLQATTRFFVITNLACAVGSVILLWHLLRRLTTSYVATLVTLAFCGANSFIGFASLGSAYVPALFFETFSLWLLSRPPSFHNSIDSYLAGVSYAISVMLWFPFVFVALGVGLSAYLWEENGQLSVLRARALRLFQAFCLTMAVGFLGGALGYGIMQGRSVRQWIADSDNGWSQSLNLVRSLTGIPRSLFELSSDTVLLKRWFFHDPYHPVSLQQLAGALLVKLILFYVGIGGLLYLLGRLRIARRMLVVFCAAAIPLLFFAVFVFEPGSTSRYLPVLPFLYLAAAVALHRSSRGTPAYWAVVILLTSVVILNLITLGWGRTAAIASVREQKGQLQAALTGPADVYIATLHEPFYYVPISRPLDHSLYSQSFVVKDLIELASNRLPHWRSKFASATLADWQNNRDVWVATSLLSPMPPSDSSWVEGDDRRVSWKDIHNLFQQVQIDRTESGPSGFSHIARNGTNRLLFQALMATDPQTARP